MRRVWHSDSTEDFLTPFIEPIYRTFVSALNMHHTRALLVTLETLDGLVESLDLSMIMMEIILFIVIK